MNICLRLFVGGLAACLLSVAEGRAEKCYAAKDAFAVIQPAMVTRGCFLFHHGANVDLRHQSEMVITRKELLHPDPIHSEFLSFILDGKLITLSKGTPLFSCQYDLQTLAKDFQLSGNTGGATRTLGYKLPAFNCAGITTKWAPVRPINKSHCYWVAVSLIRCEESDRLLRPINVMADEEE
ncbi:MAG: hypothetical protein CSA33_02195 [Desulfobulbus propionicus]|nr:MAG: hypothetical protein CSA33_02195 [Desulfobulbus propionicus]